MSSTVSPPDRTPALSFPVIAPMDVPEAREAPPPAAPAPARTVPPTASLEEIVTLQQLRAALETQSRMPVMKTGEALLSLGLLTPEQLERGLRRQKDSPGMPLGKILVELKLVSQADLHVALVRKMGYPLVDVTRLQPQPEALRRMPLLMASRLRVLPLMIDGKRLVVAMEDPLRSDVVREIELSLRLEVQPVLARAEALSATTRHHYESLDTLYVDFGGTRLRAREFSAWQSSQARPTALPDFNWHTGPAPLAEPPERASAGPAAEAQPIREAEDESVDEAAEAGQDDDGSDSPLARLLHHIIGEAHARGATDIHFDSDPGRQKVRVRFRRDGVLQPYLELPHHCLGDLVARLKIMGGLDVSECLRPQGGRIDFSRFVPERQIELRVLTVPTYGGREDAVLRLLSPTPPLPLDRLGLSESNLGRLREAVERPDGLVLCAGPTGSGRTTTLHAALAHLDTPGRKLWTIEDPVEITRPGLSQMQIDPWSEPSFAAALRALLPADPDVILLGEVRDMETARTAVEASLTGHLVLSALSASSAPEAVTRLLDMGIDPFGFADALVAVLAQRLVRRLCEHCRQPRPATQEEIEELLADWLRTCPKDDPRFEAGALRREWEQRFARDGHLVLHRAAGCKSCHGTGFHGRTGLHELLLVSPELRHLIRTGAPSGDLRRQAMREGLRTLRQDGIEKVLQGVTTLAEVRATTHA